MEKGDESLCPHPGGFDGSVTARTSGDRMYDYEFKAVK